MIWPYNNVERVYFRYKEKVKRDRYIIAIQRKGNKEKMTRGARHTIVIQRKGNKEKMTRGARHTIVIQRKD